MPSQTTKGTLLVFLAASGYALLPIFTRFIYQDESQLTPLGIGTWRFIVAVSAVWLIMLFSGGLSHLTTLTRYQIGVLLGLGAIFGGAAFLAAASLERVSASTYTLLIYTYPAMVAIFSFALGEHLTLNKWVAVGLALLGCSLTISGKIEVGSLIDAAFPIVNALAYAFYLTLAGRYNRVGGLPSAAISMTGSLAVLLPVALLSGLPVAETRPGWLSLIGLGTISTTLPIILMFAGMKYIGASNAAILSTIEPIMVLLWAAALLGERITGMQVVGGACILTSVILLNLPFVKKQEALAT